MVEYPFLKPVWFSEIMLNSFAKISNLELIIEVNNFPRQLINVIALKLSGSVGLPLFLKTGLIIPLVQLSGMIPESKTKLNSLQYIETSIGGEFLNIHLKFYQYQELYCFSNL